MNQSKNAIPDNLLSLLNERLQMLTYLIGKAEKDLKNPPDGTLRMIMSHGSKQYYHCSPGCTHIKYIRQSDAKLPQRIAQRDYAKLTMDTAKKEYRVLTDFVKHYEPDLDSFIAGKLPEYKQELIRHYVESDADFITHWLAIKEKIKSENITPMQIKYPVNKENGKITTERGDYVRSKSEKILADKLLLRNIPYSYECPLYIRNFGYLNPDFTVLNVNTRKELYWEHLGKMDDPEYSVNAILKIESYEQNKIYPGSSLILTYESLSHPFDSALLDGLISEYLI